jgi:hypothetical protein
MSDKVVKVDDLIGLLERTKMQIQTDSKLILTEEQRKTMMSEAMAKGDPKEKILAAHKSMNSVRMEGVAQGKTEVVDWLITLLKGQK